jgi:hypothetical protein
MSTTRTPALILAAAAAVSLAGEARPQDNGTPKERADSSAQKIKDLQ